MGSGDLLPCGREISRQGGWTNGSAAYHEECNGKSLLMIRMDIPSCWICNPDLVVLWKNACAYKNDRGCSFHYKIRWNDREFNYILPSIKFILSHFYQIFLCRKFKWSLNYYLQLFIIVKILRLVLRIILTWTMSRVSMCPVRGERWHIIYNLLRDYLKTTRYSKI